MKRPALAILFFFVLLYVLPLGVRPLFAPDETRYVVVPHEMLVTGDWIVPRLLGLRYFDKPPLAYWTTAISMSAFGEGRFAQRLPSALAAGLTAWLLFGFARRSSGGRGAGLLTAAIFLTCGQVFALGVFNTLDGLLTLLLTGGMVSFYRAAQADPGRERNHLLAAFGAFCGLAFLVKGFLAFAVPVLAIAPFMLWERRIRDLFMFAWLPLVVAVLVILPWSVAISLQEPGFWDHFIFHHHVNRFLSPHAEHPRPPWFFVRTMALGALPWTVLIPAAFMGVRKRLREEVALRYALCWFLFPFLFFSASTGKLGTYIQPCYPPLAIMLAAGLQRYLAEGRWRTYNGGAWLLSGILLLGALGVALAQLGAFGLEHIFEDAETWKWISGFVALLAWSGLMMLSARAVNSRRKLALFLLAPLLFMFSLHFIIPKKVGAKIPGEFFERNAPRVGEESALVTSGEVARSAAWFFKRLDVYVTIKRDEMWYGFESDPASEWRFIPPDELADFIADEGGEHPVISVIMESEEMEDVYPLLPEPFFKDESPYFIFMQFRRGDRLELNAPREEPSKPPTVGPTPPRGG